MPEIVDDAALAVCELVANAVRHGLSRPVIPPCPVRLLLFGSRRALLCVVTDPNDAPPLLREPDYVAETGRGLQVVAGVSEMWGWTPIHPGERPCGRASRSAGHGWRPSRRPRIPSRPRSCFTLFPPEIPTSRFPPRDSRPESRFPRQPIHGDRTRAQHHVFGPLTRILSPPHPHHY